MLPVFESYCCIGSHWSRIRAILGQKFRLIPVQKLYVIIFLSLFCLDASSQGRLKTQGKFGLKFGTGAQSVTGCPITRTPRVAFMAGFWVQIPVGRNWTMQAELINIGKGTGLGLRHPGPGDYWLNLNYFEVPVLFQLNSHKAYFEFGPSLSALINTGEYTNGGMLPYEADLYPFSNRDFSFSLGIGRVMNEKWRVGLRLTHSLLPVRQQLPGASRAVYNRGIILAFSRQIRFKGRGERQSGDGD